MKTVKIVSTVLAAAALLAACNSSVEFKKTRAGVPYKIFSENKGDSIKPDYIVKFHVIQSVKGAKDTTIFNSYGINNPIYRQVQLVSGPVENADIMAALMETLLQARKGDSIYLVQSADSILAKAPAEQVSKMAFKKGDQVITTVRIVEVYKTEAEARAASMKDMIAGAPQREKDALEQFRKDTMVQNSFRRDNPIIEDYLRRNNIQTQKTPWGAYMQIIDAGQGEKAKIGQYVKVKYKGYTLDGKTFDSGEYPIQVGMGGSIKGFEEGALQLGRGGRGTVFVPSILGYGPAGNQGIKPNENLVFDLEILEISDTPPAQQPQMPPATQNPQ